MILIIMIQRITKNLFWHHHYNHQQNHERKYMWRFYQSGIGEFRLCQKDKGQICNDENIMKL